MAFNRIKKSDPEFERMFTLANDYAILLNPQRWFNLANEKVPQAEYNAQISYLCAELDEALFSKRLDEALEVFKYIEQYGTTGSL